MRKFNSIGQLWQEEYHLFTPTYDGVMLESLNTLERPLLFGFLKSDMYHLYTKRLNGFVRGKYLVLFTFRNRIRLCTEARSWVVFDSNLGRGRSRSPGRSQDATPAEVGGKLGRLRPGTHLRLISQ